MSNAVKTLPQVTVGTTPLQIAAASHKWASVSIQADPANTGKVFVGDVNVSLTRYSRVLNAGDWWSISGSSVDPLNTWVLGSVAGQIVHPSGS